MTRKPLIRAQDPVAAGSARPWTVDEELRQRFILLRPLLLGWEGLEQRPLQLLHPGAGRSADREDALQARVVELELRRLRQQVDLVQDDDLRSLLETGSVLLQLVVDRAEPLDRIAVRRVDHVQQQPGALEVRQELVAEADALARSFDQAGNVGDRDLPAVGRVNRAEDGAIVVNR